MTESSNELATFQDLLIKFFNEIVLERVKICFPGLNPIHYQLIPCPGQSAEETLDTEARTKCVSHFNDAYDSLVAAASQRTLKASVDFFNSPPVRKTTEFCYYLRPNYSADWGYLSINYTRAANFFSDKSNKSRHQYALINLVKFCMRLANARGYQITAMGLLTKMERLYYAGLPPTRLDSCYQRPNYGSGYIMGMSVMLRNPLSYA